MMRVVFPPNRLSNRNKNKARDAEYEPSFIKVTTNETNTLLIEKNGDLWGIGPSPDSQFGITSKQVKFPINLSLITRTRFIEASSGVDYIIGETDKNQIYLWGNCAKFKQSPPQLNIVFENHIDQDYKISAIDLTEHINNCLQQDNKIVIKKKRLSQKRSIEISSIHSQSSILCTQESHIVIPNYFGGKVEGFNCEQKKWYFYSSDRLISLNGQLNAKISLKGLACSPNHCLCWDQNGGVWSWGEYTDGKLGYMEFRQKQQTQPRIIEGLSTSIIQCACSSSASLALDNKGHLYFWGQSTVPRSLVAAMEPKMIPMNTTFIKICAGNEHYGALDILGQIYFWGINTGNCIGELPEQVFKPQLIDMSYTKVLDIAMSQNRTVLIVPSTHNNQLPQLNKLNYLKIQRERIINDTSLIRNKTERKERLQKEYSVYKPDTQNEKEENQNYEKTTQLIQKIRTMIDQKQTNLLTFDQSCISYESQSARFDTGSKTVHEPVDYDSVQTKIRKLELKNPIFLPVITEKLKTNQNDIDDDYLDLANLLQTDNELLKCEYIDMVKNQGEEKVLVNLLREHPQRSSTIIREKRRLIPKAFIPEKEKTFQDSYDRFDSSLLQRVKLDISNLKQERYQKFLQQQRLKEMHLDNLKSKILENPLQMSFAYQLEHIQQQAAERNQKIKYAQLKKQQQFDEKIQHAQMKLYLKSSEYKAEQKIKNEQKKIITLQFISILQYLNVESICQLFVESNQKVIEQRTDQIRRQINARVIQSAIRKRNCFRKVKNLTERQVKIIESLIFRIRVYLNIQIKRKIFRKINLFSLRKSLKHKFIERISTILIATHKLQDFFLQKKQKPNSLHKSKKEQLIKKNTNNNLMSNIKRKQI